MRIAPGRRVELLGRPGLAGDGVARNRREASGARLDDARQEFRERTRGGRGHDLPHSLGVEAPRLAAIGVERRLDEPRLHQGAAVGDGAEGRDQLERGHRDFLADRHGRERQERPALGVAQEPATLAGEPHARRRAEAKRLHVPVVAVATERQPHLDRPDVRGVLQHLGEAEPAVLLPVADRGPGERDRAVLGVDPVVGPDHALLERRGGQDGLER